MTDRDGDSRMQGQDESDSERSSRSSIIFPHEAMSTPPQSQPRNVTMEKEDTLMGDANDQAHHLSSGLAGTNSSLPRTNLAGNTTETDTHAPGWAWRNRRAVEEFDKNSEAMQDKQFSLEEFGDIVLEQLMEQEAGYDPYAPISSFIEGR